MFVVPVSQGQSLLMSGLLQAIQQLHSLALLRSLYGYESFPSQPLPPGIALAAMGAVPTGALLRGPIATKRLWDPRRFISPGRCQLISASIPKPGWRAGRREGGGYTLQTY